MESKEDNGFIHALTDQFYSERWDETLRETQFILEVLKVLAINSQNGHLQHIQLCGYAVVTDCTSLLWANI